MIKAVLCDLGDTLINFHEVDVFKVFRQGAKETYRYLMDELKLSVPPFGRYHRHQQWSLRWAYLKSLITQREFNSLDILRKCTAKLRIPLAEDQFDELAWRWYRPLAAAAKTDPFAVPMIEELLRRGLKLAIVSNTFVPPATLDRHLVQENLIQYFPLRVYSCEVGVRKPRMQIFKVAMDKLLITPEETVFIGDSPVADIWGARQAEMFAILKINTIPKKVRSDSRTFVVHSLDHVPAVIDRINATFFSQAK